MRTRFQAGVLATVVGLGTVLGTGGHAAAAPTSRNAVSNDAVAYHKSFVTLWNEQRFEAIHDFYLEDAIISPPNHDLIRGRDAIVAFFRTVRPVLGELQVGNEPHSVVKSGNVTTVMGNYVFRNSVRLTSIEVYERQADGRYECKLDQFGFRDPLK